MRKDWLRLGFAILVAALLWFYMFSPWTHGAPNFWIVMSFSAVTLMSLGLGFTPDRGVLLKVERPLLQLIGGVLLAFALWGVFWVGDKLPQWLIALLLIFLIGPAEELFWRGYVQRTFSRLFGGKHPADLAFIVTALIYALVHIWSFNFMLVMAALVAGAVWGFIYRISPKTLPALVVSHALWDVLVFILLPI